MANVVVSAISTFNNKGLKKGKKEISAFEKQVKTFGRTFAAAFSVTALTRFSREAVKAFAADEAAAKALEIQLKNTGYQFSSPAVELYIANLQKTTGVLDDELRPAFQQLLTVTGSITMSQDALNTAMDVSAATGKSLTAVTTALSRAYAGNTTGLSRLGAGLNKALLKTGDMDAIMAELNNKFSGQAIARLDTYAGKLSLLSVAAANSREIIGKGLLDALSALGKDNSIEGATNSMEDFATATSEVLVGLGKVAGKLKEIASIGGIDGSFLRNVPGIGAFIRGTELLRGAGRQEVDRGGRERSATRIAAQQKVLEARAIKNTVALRKAENDQLKKKTAVEQLKDKFDLERIGLTVALNEAVDAETKLRLKAQLAILDNDEAMAKKILAEMNATDSLNKLAGAADLTIGYFTKLAQSLVGTANYLGMTYQQILDERLRESGRGYLSQPIVTGSNRIPALPASYFQNLGTTLEGSANYAGMSASEISMERLRESGNRPVNLTLTVDTANSGDRFSQLIAESIQLASRSGYGTTPAGSLP